VKKPILILTLNLVFICTAHTNVLSQIMPYTILQYRFSAPIPANGPVSLTVRWYSGPVGGTALHTETLGADVLDSIAELTLGRNSPPPDNIWLQGASYLGVTVDSEQERRPRVQLVAVPIALAARRAEVAERLAPEVTGVVTSVNEVAGGIWLIGDNGITVQRTGGTFRIGGQIRDSIVSGHVNGDGKSHQLTFSVPVGKIELNHVTTSVSSPTGSIIAVEVVNIDNAVGLVTVRTSAVLAPSEAVHWTLRLRN